MIRVLSREEVRQALPMVHAITVMKSAFAQLSSGQADAPLRLSVHIPPHNGIAFFMPAYLSGDDRLAVKIVSVFNDNPARGLPLIHALVVVLDATTGEPAAVMDGTYLTALRTGAASGAATDLLARPDAEIAAIFGAGVQGRTQLEAVCTVRPIRQAWVYDPQRERAEEFAVEMSARLMLPVWVADSPEQATRPAHIICTATTSSTPVFADADVRPGTHINAIGAYTPQMQEVPAETVARARVVIDHHQASLAEAGDLLIPLRQGLITEAHIHAELGEIVDGTRPGRASPEEITLFKSVGVAVQDAAAAGAVLEAARQAGLGTEVTL
jgi:ornithine cyclodeaminase/alanine dehydrogenase-like protein (mu-crystallin family)